MLSIRPPELEPPKPEGRQIELFFGPAEPAETPEIHLNLILDTSSEVSKWRRRTTVLASIFFHILLIILLVVGPDLIHAGAKLMGIRVEQQKKPETTMLFLPPDLAKQFKKHPPTKVLSDKDRMAQGAAPKIDPNGIRMPYSKGNSTMPEQKGGAQKPEPKPSPPAAQPQPAQVPPAGQNNAQEAQGAGQSKQQLAENTPKKEAPSLLEVPEAGGGKQISQLRMPAVSPGEMIRQSASAAARDRASGIGSGPGDSIAQFRNFNPNFSMEGPQILSDTKGVDFGPYLARVVYSVRQNWYSVIPESARLGEKGRVAVVFEIVKNGAVPQLRLVASSGADALDRAALAGIRASSPFPPLPPEFTGEHLVLEFIFLYNLGYEQ